MGMFVNFSGLNASHYVNQSVWTTQDILRICGLPNHTILRLAIGGLGLLAIAAVCRSFLSDASPDRVVRLVEHLDTIAWFMSFVALFVIVALYWLRHDPSDAGDMALLIIPLLFVVLALVAGGVRSYRKRKEKADLSEDGEAP